VGAFLEEKMKVHLAPTRTRNILAHIPTDQCVSVQLTGGSIKGQWGGRNTLILHVTVQGDPNGIKARKIILAAEKAAYPRARRSCLV